MSHELSEAYSEFYIQSFGTKKAGQSRFLLVMAQVTAAYRVQGQLKWKLQAQPLSKSSGVS